MKNISIITLVNKKNSLDNDYVPDNMRLLDLKCAENDKYMVIEAALNFEKLCSDALLENYKITAVSTYRSYEYQQKLFNYYVKTRGYKYASRASAKPGCSEHQTGLAVDVMGENNDYNLFESTKEFKWMIKNAHKYGFILRYPKGKEKITGYMYEPWHYRYVGSKLATTLYEENITLEEYYNINQNQIIE